MNNKVIAIHQPNYFPWVGYFIKMAVCDVFVFHDNVEYTKSGVTRRVKIADINKSPKTKWLTVPLQKHSDFSKIFELQILNEMWIQNHINNIQATYKTYPYFEECMSFVETVLNRSRVFSNLSELNIFIIKEIAKALTFNHIEFLKSSDIKVPSGLAANDLNLALVKACNGDTYISGKGALKYQDVTTFNNDGVSVLYIDSKTLINHYSYAQIVPTHDYGVSIIDMWMNVGIEKVKEFIEEQGSILVSTPINTAV